MGKKNSSSFLCQPLLHLSGSDESQWAPAPRVRAVGPRWGRARRRRRGTLRNSYVNRAASILAASLARFRLRISSYKYHQNNAQHACMGHGSRDAPRVNVCPPSQLREVFSSAPLSLLVAPSAPSRAARAAPSALERWMIHKLRSSSVGAASTTPPSGAPSRAVRRNA